LTTSPNSESQDDRYLVIQAGFNGDISTARDGLQHADPMVRISALRALHRLDELHDVEISNAITDSDSGVRRCAAELSASRSHIEINVLLHDDDVFVAEMAAWALGERTTPSDADIDSLIDAAYHHNEALVREAAAAALGSLGDQRGLPAILHACKDKPAVRRRAVLALAPFEGPEVDAALEAALSDRDWQVRQNAEDLLHPRGY
jgi:HEAT repeat protein